MGGGGLGGICLKKGRKVTKECGKFVEGILVEVESEAEREKERMGGADSGVLTV